MTSLLQNDVSSTWVEELLYNYNLFFFFAEAYAKITKRKKETKKRWKNTYKTFFLEFLSQI